MTTQTGRLVISFDVELAWGSIESERWSQREANGVYVDTRASMRELLDAFDAYEIPATFAIVGGMLEEPGKWALDHLPDVSRDRTWQALRTGQTSSFHGNDILEMIAGRRTPHLVGSHSYSHTRFQHPGVTEHFVREDLRNFWRVLPEGINAAPVLVFPQNDEGFYDTVRESGFRAVRGGDPAPAGRYRWQRQLQALFATPPLTQITQVGGGLLRNTGSMPFISGPRRRLVLVERLARLGLERAIRQGGTLHLWNHPFNFAETPGLLPAFIRFLRRVAALRDRGLIEIGAMEMESA